MNTALAKIRDEYNTAKNHGTRSYLEDARNLAINNFEWALAEALKETVVEKSHSMADNYPAGQTTGEPCNYCLKVAGGSDAIVSQIDAAVGMLTVTASHNKFIAKVKELLTKTSIELGELFEE